MNNSIRSLLLSAVLFFGAITSMCSGYTPDTKKGTPYHFDDVYSNNDANCACYFDESCKEEFDLFDAGIDDLYEVLFILKDRGDKELFFWLQDILNDVKYRDFGAYGIHANMVNIKHYVLLSRIMQEVSLEESMEGVIARLNNIKLSSEVDAQGQEIKQLQREVNTSFVERYIGIGGILIGTFVAYGAASAMILIHSKQIDNAVERFAAFVKPNALAFKSMLGDMIYGLCPYTPNIPKQ